MTDANGLYYMRARYYNPKLKRFINRDIICGDVLDGQTFNRYAYVNGDPVSFVDPLGLFKGDGKEEIERTGDADELIPVYRGTNNYLENAIYDETGHLLSDASRIAYRESGNLANAYKASQPIHDEWL